MIAHSSVDLSTISTCIISNEFIITNLGHQYLNNYSLMVDILEHLVLFH